jgi:hypothetical protein
MDLLIFWQFHMLPKSLEMVHGFTTPLLVDNNRKQLLNGKLRYLGIIKPSLQTCNDKPTKQIV